MPASRSPSPPFSGLLPKTSTGAKAFTSANPAHDGHGVLIAILDTGVDPGAAGLQQTSCGLPKIVDVQDCTGAGDVDMKTVAVAQLDEETNKHFVVGKSGNRVYLDHRWFKSSEEEEEDGDDSKERAAPPPIRIGLKSVYELFPCDLVDRLKRERKQRFLQEHNEAEAKAGRHAAAAAAGSSKPAAAAAAGASTSKPTCPELNEEPQNQLAELKRAMDDYVDLGPVADVLSFQDDEGLWRVVVNGNAPLREFRVQQEFVKWDDNTQLNYCVNVFERGDVVCLVIDSGSHGTHVASIASAYYGEEDNNNGVAPGAQIISLKIGDIRLGGGMETANAICRALAHCATNQVDVINMSFGEAYLNSTWNFASGTRVLQLMRELVEQHNITFVASAGNAGPALSTVSAPGGLLPSLISVGAVVDSNMKGDLYSLLPSSTATPEEDEEATEEEESEALNYTWSSRGPALDGALGVSVSAPGGAITSIPQWNLQGKQLMNGTSMSAPNCAGSVALLIGALRLAQLKHSPARIKRALESSAAVLASVEPFAQGHGLIQIPQAFAQAKLAQEALHFDLPFDVQVYSLAGGRPTSSRALFMSGVYIRDNNNQEEATERHDFDVQVQARFPLTEHARIGFHLEHTTRAQEVEFELEVDLECAGSWVKLPKSRVYIHSHAVAFKLQVHTGELPPGAHFCEVMGFDAQHRDAGPLFRVPVTVIVPHQSTSTNLKTEVPLELRAPHELKRHFFRVPRGATWCEVGLESEDTSTMLAMHCVQTQSHSRFRKDEASFTGRLTARAIKRTMRVAASASAAAGLLEVCVAKYWSQDVGSITQAKLRVEFFGVEAPSTVDLHACNSFVGALPLQATLRAVADAAGELLQAPIELNRQHVTVAPTKSQLAPLFSESRNAVLGAYPPDSRILWQLQLEYDFTLPASAAGGKPFSVKMRPPRLGLKLNEFLYEHFLESQFIQVFEGGRLVMCGDYVGGTDKEMELKSRGPFRAVAFLRHEDRRVLERLEGALPLVLDLPLAQPIKLACYNQPIVSQAHLVTGNKVLALARGQSATLFLSMDASCKALFAGSGGAGGCFSGSFKLTKDSPVSHTVTLNLPPPLTAAAAKKPAATAAPTPAKADEEAQWLVPLIEAKLALLKTTLGNEAVFTRELALVLDDIARVQQPAANRDLSIKAQLLSLQRAEAALEAKLNHQLTEDDVDGGAAGLAELVQLQHVCQLIRTTADAGSEPNEAATAALITATTSEIHALLDAQSTIPSSSSNSDNAALDTLVELLEKKKKANNGASPNNNLTMALLYIHVRLSMRVGRYATALQHLDKLLAASTGDEQQPDAALLAATKLTVRDVKQRKLDLYELLEWTHVASRFRERMLAEHPPAGCTSLFA